VFRAGNGRVNLFRGWHTVAQVGDFTHAVWDPAALGAAMDETFFRNAAAEADDGRPDEGDGGGAELSDVHPFMPLPAIEPDTKAFWEACRDGRLAMLRCRDCRWIVIRRGRCARAAARATSRRGSVGRATRRHVHDQPSALDARLEVPYVIGDRRADRAARLRLTTNLVNVAPERVRSACRFGCSSGR
jgi:uncharacterized OB-fold protein